MRRREGPILGGGDRQSHRGSALSLIGWGLSPRPQGKGVPSDSTTCRPSNHPSHSLQAPQLFPLPLSPAHTAAPLSLLHAPLHACSPLSPPLPGLQFCTNLPSRCLAHSAFASGWRGPLKHTLFLAHAAFPFSCSMPPALILAAYTLFPYQGPPLHTPFHISSSPLALDPCCRHTWDTFSLPHSQTPCTSFILWSALLFAQPLHTCYLMHPS